MSSSNLSAMELVTSSWLLIIAAMLLWRALLWWSQNRSQRLPPGTMGLPFIGETLQFIFKPTEFFQSRELKHGHVYKTHLLFSPTVSAAGSENVKKILVDREGCLSIQWPRGMRILLGEHALGQSAGACHRLRKKAVLKTFCPANLDAYLPAMSDTIQRSLDVWCEQERVVVYESVQRLTLRLACRVILGLSPTDQRYDAFTQIFQDFAKGFFSLAIPLPGTAFYKALRGKERIHCMIRERIADIRSSMVAQVDFVASDVLSHLVISGELSDHEIQDLVTEMCFAGYETVAGMMSVLVMLLGRNPAVLAKLRAEINNELSRRTDSGADHTEYRIDVNSLERMTYCSNVLRETLRLYPAIGGGFRKVEKPFQIEDYIIPRGWTLIYSVWNTHRLSGLFGQFDPKSFNPDQWSTYTPSKETAFQYIPFGVGGRCCVGKAYARLVLRAFLIVLASKCDWELCSNDYDVNIVPVMKPKDGLPAVFHRRN